jgi:dihydrofolate synthase / folylpolyglutamate synthase
MGFATLAEWLAFQETLHPQTIDLGLGRIREVLSRLDLPPVRAFTISVAGTNGKGSCVAMLDSILRAAGYRVGTYTSPHILRYNERIGINGVPASDERLLQAFERIEAARGDISLSFFEFGTLAALILFSEEDLDVHLLEVGLGGRLDAVNVVDADIALIASIDIDHQDWLGDNRESIGFEKAGIIRSGKPVVLGDPDAPKTVVDVAEEKGAPCYRSAIDFSFRLEGQTWFWVGDTRTRGPLPFSAIPGDHQFLNGSAVIQCLELLPDALRVSEEAICEGLRKVRLPGRFQFFPGETPVLLDVAHNPQSVGILARHLAKNYPDKKIRAVFSVMRDKDISAIVRLIQDQIEAWYLAPLSMTRAASPVELAEILHNAGVDRVEAGFAGVGEALAAAKGASGPDDMILVFGSFFLVSDYLAMLA